MPDNKYDNKGQKPTTAESNQTPETPKAVEKTPASAKPDSIDNRLAQMDSRPASAPAFSSIPSSDNKESAPKVEAKSAQVKKPEPEVTKPAPEQKSFEKMAEKPKESPAPEPKWPDSSVPASDDGRRWFVGRRWDRGGRAGTG